MQQKTIELFTNPRQLLNTPYFMAQGVGHRAAKLTKYNWKFKFPPPTFDTLRLLPYKLDEGETETFTEDMFTTQGFLHEVPLNFFVKLTPYNLWLKPQPAILLNAGYLLGHLLMGDKIFYEEIARLITNVKDASPTSTASSPTKGIIPLQEEGNADGEGDSSGPSGDDN